MSCDLEVTSESEGALCLKEILSYITIVVDERFARNVTYSISLQGTRQVRVNSWPTFISACVPNFPPLICKIRFRSHGFPGAFFLFSFSLQVPTMQAKNSRLGFRR